MPDTAPTPDRLAEVLAEPPTPDYDGREAMRVFGDIAIELRKAMRKFPGQHLPLGFGAQADGWLQGGVPYRAGDIADLFRALTDQAADRGTLTWRHVLTEEGAEAFAEEDTTRARAELVQLAAMSVRAILDIDHPAPVHFTGPCGAVWDQVGIDDNGAPVMTRRVKEPLTPSGVAAPARAGATEAPDD